MWKEIRPEEITGNTFEMIGKQWMLVTAGDENKANSMTASWGGLGIMWGKPVATSYIRPQRYTKKFLDSMERFTLSFYEEAYRPALTYMGRVSGASEDKMKGSGLTPEMIDGVPAFAESSLVLVCRKLYAQDLKKECFMEPELADKNYPQNDYHTMYISEIEHVYVKE